MMDALWTARRLRQHKRFIRRSARELLPRYTGRMALIAVATAALIAGTLAIWTAGAYAEGMIVRNVYLRNPEGVLNVREGAGETYRVRQTLAYGTGVVVLDRLDGWAQVARPERLDDALGWVLEAYLTAVQTETQE